MMERSTIPLYSETDAMRWLAWLAYHMRDRDLTLFEIENLQPSWLTDRDEITAHLAPMRILFGVISGLIDGLINNLFYGLFLVQLGFSSYNLIYALIYSLIHGVITGLIIGLLEVVIPIHKFDVWLRNLNNSTKQILIGIFIHGLIATLIVGRVNVLLNGFVYGMLNSIFFGLIYGYIRTTRITQRDVDSSICTVESLQWSWQRVRQNAKIALITGLSGGLITGLSGGLIISLRNDLIFVQDATRIITLSDGLIFGLIGGLIIGLISGLVFGLIGGIIGGFQPGPQSLKIRPNHGIWLTIQSALKIGLSTGILIGILIWLLTSNIESGIVYGVTAIFITAFWYGGQDAFEHGIIRDIIAKQGYAPLDYARFLDYAANELIFLQKVGGGYVFIHRYLLEHFAEIAVERGYVDVNARRHPQSY